MLRLLLAALALATSAPALAQATWYVDASAPGPGSGTLQDPYPSIQQAIDAPSTLAGDMVDIAPGAYLESLDLGGKTLSLVGDPVSPPVVRGNGLDRLLRLTSGEGPGTAFFDLEFIGGTGGQSGFLGGAVIVENSSAMFVSCRFFANRICSSGGAVGALASDITFISCIFESNSAGTGGAIRAENGTLTVRDCHFEDNLAGQPQGCSGGNGQGGGISTQGARIECVDSSFLENRGGAGGAMNIRQNPGGEIIERCHFERNGVFPPAPSGIAGGAVFSRTFTLEDCVFRSNGGRRGGAVNEGTYRNCLFEGNTGEYGGAAYLARLEDCVLRDNHALEINSNVGEGGATHSCEHLRCVIVGNTCASGAGACDNALSIDRCTIVGNVGFPDHAAVRGSSLASSIVWGNRSVSPAWATTQVEVNSMAFSMVEGDPSSIAGPPLLFGRDVGDAHLIPGSPAIDAASPSLPADPDGSPADLGALTFDPLYRTAPARFCDAKTTAAGCLPGISLVGLPSVTGAPARIEARDVPTSTAGLLLLSADAQAAPFFGGTLCVGGSIVRSGVASAVPASGCGDRLEFDLGPTELAGVGVSPGDLIFVQIWFRDAQQSDGTGVGISDAIVATVEL